MARKNKGFNKSASTANSQIKPGQTVINDFSIDIRTVDITRKDLTKWRNAYQSAISIERPNRKALYDIYTDILIDDHLKSVINQRRLAVTNSNIVFQNEGNPVDSINNLLNSEHFDLFLKHALDSRFWGYSLIHADFKNDLFELVPRSHVVPKDGIVVADPYDITGISYTKSPYSYYYIGVGEPDDLGLLLIATILVLIKRGNLSDWAQFNEIFGQPMRKGTYDPHMPGNKTQLLQALEQAGAMSYIAVPNGSNVEFIEANKSGASDTYDGLYEKMEKGLSKLIVGQTMTTEDGSSRSQGEVHERVAQAIAQDDRLFVTKLLNGRVRNMMIAQGFPEAATGEFQFMDEEATIPKDKRLTMDLSIHTQVAPLTIEYFEQEYNVVFDMEALKKREEEKTKAAAQIPVPGKPDPKQNDKTKLALSLLDRIQDFFVAARH
ncbi:phage portal protein family protein [Dyadobacter frigoris]|uniref:DUF935 family protein n=1 Tax=Dyadobacter frigoris TaxID=2576211 RepID=A0A4U6CZW8_9BACT|nr:DUF935 family protein [Dyadobacter frigoris]TKT89485.1 DUF935 family protein [Dyadobacter frigoris]